MAGRFDYIAYDEIAASDQRVFKYEFEELEHAIDSLPSGRAKYLALTKLEECYMWIGEAIRDGQLARNGSAPLEEGRSDS